MDEKIKDQEALLMKDSKDENLKALSGTDEKGGLKTVSPTAEHEQIGRASCRERVLLLV